MRMTNIIPLTIGLLATIVALPTRTNAMPLAVSNIKRPAAAYGLFPKVRFPRINIGKGAKAILYPVTKTAVSGGKLMLKGAKTGVEVYETGRALSNKTNGIPGIPHLK